MREPMSEGIPAEPARRQASWWRVLALVWVVSALYVGHGLNRGWIPHDEGTLAQSAERVLGGELPHRDFDEVYTGGLSYANAAAFRLFGTNLLSLRFLLFLVFLAWVPALYIVATRFAGPAAAGLVTALGVAWSVPNYSAALPSWYNLFCATFGTAALLRHVETGRRRWLVAAGLAGGLSCLAKIVGLYYVAGVLLFLVFRERALLDASPGPRVAGWQAYPLAVGTGLLSFVVVLVWLIHRQLGVVELVQFVAPGAALAAFAYHESATGGGRAAERMATLFRLVAPFAVGTLLPVAIFLVPYLRSGAVATLWSGVFVAPARRFEFAARALPGVATLLAALPVGLVLGLVPARGIPARRTVLGVVLLALAVFLALSRHAVWYSIRPLLPLAVCVGVWRLARARPELSGLRRQQITLVLCIAALVSLVQFPFAAPIYFLYVAPLAALAVLAVVTSHEHRVGFVPGAAVVLYLLFAVVDTHPSHEPTGALALARGGGLIIPARDKVRYEGLVTALQAHATGVYGYAAPDCPEVYFLAGLRNPTRTIFEFLEDSAGRSARVLRTLAAHGITAVALNARPPFSGPLPPDLLDSLAHRYPREQSLDGFVVRWRP
ncbi:MAG TPA: glycosyltransferase family 39 protein [Gemmatimonadales bacterium]|nr:glycosyltransferase family 39 protein [Gemmatimonadales bacterium]